MLTPSKPDLSERQYFSLWWSLSLRATQCVAQCVENQIVALRHHKEGRLEKDKESVFNELILQIMLVDFPEMPHTVWWWFCEKENQWQEDDTNGLKRHLSNADHHWAFRARCQQTEEQFENKKCLSCPNLKSPSAQYSVVIGPCDAISSLLYRLHIYKRWPEKLRRYATTIENLVEPYVSINEHQSTSISIN